MSQFPEDIYTEPSNVDVDTLKNLGPLRGMAGIWEGVAGADVHEAMRLMRQHGVRRLPVLEDGQVAGIVSLGDLAMQDEPDLAFAQLSAIAVAV